MMASRSASLVLLISTSAVRSVPVASSWTAVDELVEVVIPVGDLGVVPGQTFEFWLQVRNANADVLESLPHAGSWTLTIPTPGAAGWHV